MNKLINSNSLFKSLSLSRHSIYYKGTIRNFSLNLSDKDKDKVISWYKMKEPIVFKDKMYPLLETSKNLKQQIKIFEYLSLGASLLSGYKLVEGLYLLKPISSFIWGSIFIVATRIFKGTQQNNNYIIFSISLLDDMKTVRVQSSKESLDVDIAYIRLPEKEEEKYVEKFFKNNKDKYRSIIINNSIFFIWKESKILDKNLLNAVLKGKYIKYDK